jgi:hypothetical protein
MARMKNMHTDLQISSCWEHISTWNMHEYLSKGTTVFQMNFQGNILFTHKSVWMFFILAIFVETN